MWDLLFLEIPEEADHVAGTVSGVGRSTRTETVLSLTAFTLLMPSGKEPGERNESRGWCNSLGVDSGLGQTAKGLPRKEKQHQSTAPWNH